ncbi:MaoC/PaaZ C-terminal domain-containing protein [Leptospira terpstrae]|uniref:MaoC-like protein n=1 Tax=Leptospira terpstrae serovar Hualin str. LT 11-33 = ATCC 700639 TaxID=1257025 RepID=N1W2M3_9LEPT|nr:MaoC/PaaZ C-terminal domain-containing protein [Leptospira terpstrae]EMY61906.1 MaoC-like protein [Leptospira terpstrae serovar Hualin str. LT 11-33 = ATCC 700639]
MAKIEFDKVEVGQTLPPLDVPVIEHANLVRYAGASGDFNPIHNDPDFARKAGLDGTISHGMYVMAQVGRLCTSWAEQKDIAYFGVTFKAMTKLGEKLTIVGTIKKKFEKDGKKTVTVLVEAKNEAGEVKAGGDLVVNAV